MLTEIIYKTEHKTIYRDGNKRVKVFDKSFSKANVLNEALNQARVEETELNVPKVLAVTMIDDCWAIVAEFIEGKTLDQLIKENPKKTKHYIDLMVDLQLKMHTQKCPLLPILREKMMRKIPDESLKYEVHTRFEEVPHNDKVCHGDFCPSNIIITPDGVPYIIDWSHATQGNSSAEAARTYLLYLYNDQKEDGDYYLNRFCEKANIPRANVERWLRIVAAAHLTSNDPKEVEFLKHIVDEH